jgi:hypothetical protein
MAVASQHLANCSETNHRIRLQIQSLFLDACCPFKNDVKSLLIREVAGGDALDV